MIHSHTISPCTTTIATNNIIGQKEICREHSVGSQDLGMLKAVYYGGTHSCLAAGPCLAPGKSCIPAVFAAAPVSFPFSSWAASQERTARRPASCRLFAECLSWLVCKALWYQGSVSGCADCRGHSDRLSWGSN